MSQRVRTPTEDIEFTVDRIAIVLPVNRIVELITQARRRGRNIRQGTRGLPPPAPRART